MKKEQLSALLIIFLIIVGILTIFIGGKDLIVGMFTTQGTWSVILLIVFSFILYQTTKMGPAAMIVTVLIAGFFGAVRDPWGNYVYNKPLDWIYNYSSQAKLQYSDSGIPSLLTKNGKIEDISNSVFYGYRFIQYLILFLIIGYVMRLIFKNNNLVQKRKGNKV